MWRLSNEIRADMITQVRVWEAPTFDSGEKFATVSLHQKAPNSHLIFYFLELQSYSRAFIVVCLYHCSVMDSYGE